MLKSEKLSNSPNKMSDNCYGMKFDLSDNQLQQKDNIVAHFNQWAKMGVAWKHVTNAAFNTLRPGQNGRRYPDDIFKRIFLNENICIPINISLKFVPMGQINNIPSLVQIMAWRPPGAKPLSEPMIV